MSEVIGTHGLFCIDDDDYAAYALAMQCNAETVDSALSAQSDALETHLGRPWVSVVNGTAQNVTYSGGGGQIGPLGTVGSEISSPLTTAHGVPTDSLTSWPSGIYQIGASINWTLVTPTANSYRELMVFGLASINGVSNSSTTYVDLFRMRDYQGDGGNSGALNVVGLLDTRNVDIRSIKTFFSHGNSGGVLAVAPGNWRIWATYLGSGLNI